ncbi:hypothetical protein, partial [Phocaeicola vulgatus]|uniref:hypothetical protein n=1 Tax=Phocaeicola vulgatus TaxID=821 RepID=UPI001E5B3DC0
RTEKLSLVTPMVLRHSGRVGSRRFDRSLRNLKKFRRLFFVSARVKCDLYYCSSPNYGLLLPIT